MKVNVLNKVLILTLITLILISSIAPILTYAAEPKATPNWASTTQFDADAYQDANLNNSTKKIVGSILSVVRIVGTGISIIMIIFVAIKYMMSAPGDRAEIKKHAVIYVVGAIVLFGSAQIIGIIQNFALNL